MLPENFFSPKNLLIIAVLMITVGLLGFFAGQSTTEKLYSSQSGLDTKKVNPQLVSLIDKLKPETIIAEGTIIKVFDNQAVIKTASEETHTIQANSGVFIFSSTNSGEKVATTSTTINAVPLNRPARITISNIAGQYKITTITLLNQFSAPK